nr:alpha/beta hydrolase-fold protein [Shewanella sp. VB17]
MILLLLSPFICVGAERFSFVSTMIKEQLTIQVALPNSCNHSTNFKYPVLVVLDGSTQFEHISAGVQFLSSYAIIPEMIVIGVSTIHRLKNFTHTESSKFKGRSGGAQVYTSFLQEELLPELRDKYRIAPYEIISGHSLSGLYTSYLALTSNSEFNAAISISPSLWWDNASLVSHDKKLQKLKIEKPMRWFLSLASEPNEMKSAFDAMLGSLNKNTPDKLVLFHAQFPDETHDSTPLIGNNKALQAIFSGWNAVPEINVMSLAELQKFYQSKRLEFGYEFPMSEHQYNVYGLKASYEGKTDWGVEILEQGAMYFKLSDIIWDSLATAYALNNELEKAITASEKALQLAKQYDSVFLSDIIAQNKKLQANQLVSKH